MPGAGTFPAVDGTAAIGVTFEPGARSFRRTPDSHERNRRPRSSRASGSRSQGHWRVLTAAHRAGDLEVLTRLSAIGTPVPHESCGPVTGPDPGHSADQPRRTTSAGNRTGVHQHQRRFLPSGGSRDRGCQGRRHPAVHLASEPGGDQQRLKPEDWQTFCSGESTDVSTQTVEHYDLKHGSAPAEPRSGCIKTD